MTGTPTTLPKPTRADMEQLRATLTHASAVAMIEEGTKSCFEDLRKHPQTSQSAADAQDRHAAVIEGLCTYIRSPFADPAASNLRHVSEDVAISILSQTWGDAEIKNFATRVVEAAGLR